MNRVTSCLSFGPFASRERADELLAAGVTHVLNVSHLPSEVEAGPKSFAEVSWVPMVDNRRLLPTTAVWAIDTLHQLVCTPGSRVYVHCLAGLVRSPTITWLYLIACGIPPYLARTLIESALPGASAGHPKMVGNDHVTLVERHGRANFLPHLRRAALVPFFQKPT